MVDILGVRWALVALTVIVAVRGTPLPVRWRPVLFLAAAFFAFPSGPSAWLSIAALAGVAAYGFVALRTARTRTALVAHILVLTAAFVVSQHGDEIERDVRHAWLPLVGMPYVWLRLVHLLVETHAGRLAPPPALRYACYLVPFHQLVAGPIERYPDFVGKIEATLPPISVDEALRGLGRVTDGLVKVLVLAELAKRVGGFDFARGGWRLWIELDLYALYVYWNFAGYCDIVVGVGILCGWQPPENFDWPYLARNLVSFWTRWHATLSLWVRDHVFTPLNLRLQRGGMGPLAAGIACYVVAMVVCGLWHRTSPAFVAWGVYLGLGVAVSKLYEAALKRSLSKPALLAYRESQIARAVAVFVTFQFVATSFLLAFHPLAEAADIAKRLV